MNRFFVLLAGALISTSSALALDIDSLILKSIGGDKGLSSVKDIHSIYAKGNATMGFMKGSFEQVYQLPNKFYISITFAGFSMEQGYDGTTAWQTDMNGKRSKVTGHEEKELLKSLYLSSYEYVLNESDSVETVYTGETVFNGKNCHTVAIIFPSSDTLFTYYNTQTGLREGFVSKYDVMKATTIESNYGNYNDIPIAKSMQSKIEPLNFTITMDIDTFAFNTDIDHSRFAFQPISEIDYFFPNHKHAETIDFKYENGHIQIPVTINGNKKVWMILDSGAAANIFNKPVINDLALATIGSLPAVGVAGFEDVDLLQTDSIEIGELKLYNQVAGTMDLSQIAYASTEKENFGGIIGYDFLSRFPVLVDFEHNKLTVFDPNAYTPDSGGVPVDFHLTMQIPTIKAKVNGIEGDFIVDLGNAIGLILHSHYVQTNALEQNLSNVEKIRNLVGGIGGSVGGKSGLATKFELGTIRIDSIPVILPDTLSGITKSENIAGNIGNPVLERFKILFDYADSKLYFYPIE